MRKWNGSKWIRPEKRLAIYLRDGMSYAYCGATVEDGIILSLDHIKPDSKGGCNHESNLITCCIRCNSSRGNRPLRTFCKAVAGYLNQGIKAEDIERHVKKCAKRDLKKYRAEAKELSERRG